VDDVDANPILYTGPPPLLVPHSPPLLHHLSTLVSGIIDSTDWLFFISHPLGNQSIRKWRLVHVAFANSISLSLSCLHNGCFLVKFYVLHHNNILFNATNQRYWLQYHSLGNIAAPTSAKTTCFISPSDTSKANALKCKLVPFRCWLNLTHTNTYIHGPFDFTAFHGRKTRDRISQLDWDVLTKHSITHSLGLTFLPTPSTLTALYIYYSTILPTLLPSCSGILIWQQTVVSLTKGLGISALNHPPLFKMAAKRDLIQRGEMCALEGVSFAFSAPSTLSISTCRVWLSSTFVCPLNRLGVMVPYCCAHGNNLYGYGGWVLKVWYLKPTKVHTFKSI
jgi:hypothetical protein